MAKKAKPPEDNKVKPSETMLMPTSKEVVNLARRCATAKKESQEISGTIGEAIAKAVESKHLDRKAFSIARQLAAMSDKKLSVTYYHLLRYMDDLGLQERADKQGEMFEEREAEEEDEGEGADDGKVTPIGAAARKVAEAAGAQ